MRSPCAQSCIAGPTRGTATQSGDLHLPSRVESDFDWYRVSRAHRRLEDKAGTGLKESREKKGGHGRVVPQRTCPTHSTLLNGRRPLISTKVGSSGRHHNPTFAGNCVELRVNPDPVQTVSGFANLQAGPHSARLLFLGVQPGARGTVHHLKAQCAEALSAPSPVLDRTSNSLNLCCEVGS